MKAQRKPIAAIARAHPVLSGMFVLALLTTTVFAVRTVAYLVYWSNPEHRALTIEGWMTPGFVANSWDVPREVIKAAIGTLPDERGLTIDLIADTQGIAPKELIAKIQLAIAVHQQAASE